MKGQIFDILYSEQPHLQHPEAKLDAIEDIIMVEYTFKINDPVIVERAVDSTMNRDYMGQSGIITGFCTNRMTGNTEEDPLIIVTFENGEVESFWKQELTKIK